jgi:hypothetical protein
VSFIYDEVFLSYYMCVFTKESETKRFRFSRLGTCLEPFLVIILRIRNVSVIQIGPTSAPEVISVDEQTGPATLI